MSGEQRYERYQQLLNELSGMLIEDWREGLDENREEHRRNTGEDLGPTTNELIISAALESVTEELKEKMQERLG